MRAILIDLSVLFVIDDLDEEESLLIPNMQFPAVRWECERGQES